MEGESPTLSLQLKYNRALPQEVSCKIPKSFQKRFCTEHLWKGQLLLEVISEYVLQNNCSEIISVFIKMNMLRYMPIRGCIMPLELIKHVLKNTEQSYIAQFYCKGYKFSS